MVSVAIATYNGSKYIARQLESVLNSISNNDEVVISDDGSVDDTIEIIKKINDQRIKLYKGPKKGINQNFANAIKYCKGDIIFLCDQDDFWYPQKINSIKKVFKEGKYVLVEHNAKVIDDDNNVIYDSFFKHRKVRSGLIKNWFRNTYHGCFIAFDAKLKNEIIPIPNRGCFHDQWIGLIAEMNGKVFFLDEILMEYKRHSGNASSFKRLPIYVQIRNRLILGFNLICYKIKR